MLLELQNGAEEFSIPDRVLNLIPKNYVVEAQKLKDDRINLSLILIKSCSLNLNEYELNLSDDQFQDRILNPMLNTLTRIFKNV